MGHGCSRDIIAADKIHIRVAKFGTANERIFLNLAQIPRLGMELDKDYSVAEIRTAKNTIARQINVAAMGVYWNLGKLLFEKKIEKGHGAGVVNRLSLDLKSEFPDMGLSPRNLWDMKRFYEQYKNTDPKLRQLIAVLPWKHNLLILPLLVFSRQKMKAYR
jgi:hypothetical protein